MLKPSPLFPGARVALVCTSSAVPENRLEPVLAAIRALELEPVPYPTCYFTSRHGYLAATDAQRANDLNSAFADPSIHGVLAIRGGYGAHRILPLLNWEMIRSHPKFFSGYSDVTALHTALNQVCGLITYHTIMPSTEYYKDVGEYSMRWLKKALFGSLFGPLENPPGHPMIPLLPGTASGPLCGGNLSLIAASLGTPWEIDTKGKILFLEDIGEKTYRIDAMLTQLRNAGKFEDCAGVVLGAWTDCLPENPEVTLELSDIFSQLILSSGKPTLAGLACGHCIPSLSLPLGAKVYLNGDRGTLEVLS